MHVFKLTQSLVPFLACRLYIIIIINIKEQRQGHTTKPTQTENRKQHTVTKQKTKQRDQSAAVIGKEAPSTIPKLLHLVRLPCKHNSAARRIAKERRALIHPITTL